MAEAVIPKAVKEKSVDEEETERYLPPVLFEDDALDSLKDYEAEEQKAASGEGHGEPPVATAETKISMASTVEKVAGSVSEADFESLDSESSQAFADAVSGDSPTHQAIPTPGEDGVQVDVPGAVPGEAHRSQEMSPTARQLDAPETGQDSSAAAREMPPSANHVDVLETLPDSSAVAQHMSLLAGQSPGESQGEMVDAQKKDQDDSEAAVVRDEQECTDMPSIEVLPDPPEVTSHAIDEGGGREQQEGEARERLYCTVPPIDHASLAPGVCVSGPSPRPLTQQQMRTLYYNTYVETQPEALDAFKHHNRSVETSELYELVAAYYRALHALHAARTDMTSFVDTCQRHFDAVFLTITETVLLTGKCADSSRVSGTYEFERVRYSPEELDNLRHALRAKQEHVQQTLSMELYGAELARLNVEAYLYKLMSSPRIQSIPKNAPVVCQSVEPPSGRRDDDKSGLRDALAVMFSFQRRPCDVARFLQDTRSWITDMAGVLLRLASYDDHLFLLLHVMHCPAGLENWATPLIQPVAPGSDHGGGADDNTLVDHTLASLSILMDPAAARVELLRPLSPAAVAATTPGDHGQPSSWVVVDSEGEEDEDPDNAWVHFHENDLVAILQQFPISACFKHVLNVRTEDDMDVYWCQGLTEGQVLKQMALVSQLLKILGRGLSAYTLRRYRQFNKRVGKFVRHCVQNLADHLAACEEAGSLARDARARLRAQLDQLCIQAVHTLLAAPNLGAWQFTPDFPYDALSVDALWCLLDIIHAPGDPLKHADTAGLATIQRHLSESVQTFEEYLLTLTLSEDMFLLTAMANMARSRSPEAVVQHQESRDLVLLVTREIFHLGYVSEEAREQLWKLSRDLLSSIVAAHPWTTSALLHLVRSNILALDKMALKLFPHLRLDGWRPETTDIATLHDWLLNFEPLSVESRLARQIIASINWATDQAGETVSSLGLHHQMSLLIYKAYYKQCRAHRPGGSLPADELGDWVWAQVPHLTLHSSAQKTPQASPALEADQCQLLQKGLSEKDPLAAYLALLLTATGNSESDFGSQGCVLLELLATNLKWQALTHVLNCFADLFLEAPRSLIDNDRFMRSFQNLVASDGSLSRSAASVFYNQPPGPNLAILLNMIQHQISASERLGNGKTLKSVAFWTSLVLAVPNWAIDSNMLHVLDTICVVAAATPHLMSSVEDCLYSGIQEMKEEKRGGFLGIFGGSKVTPTFFTRELPEQPWAALYILRVEARQERESGLWGKLTSELYKNPGKSFERCYKTACGECGVEEQRPREHLVVLKVALQLLSTPCPHPSAPLLAHLFFALYLARPPALPAAGPQAIRQRAGVGYRYFESGAGTTFLKSIKARLKSEATWHREQTTEEVAVDSDRREFHRQQADLFATLTLWSDESRLHDASLSLPALPLQYCAERLSSILAANMEPWRDVLDTTQLHQNMETSISAWTSLARTPAPAPQPSAGRSTSATERLLSRLSFQSWHAVGPPGIPSVTPHLPGVAPSLLRDPPAATQVLAADTGVLLHSASVFTEKRKRLALLDHHLCDMLPNWLRNEGKNVVLSVPCTSLVNPLHRCRGPAALTKRVEEKRVEPVTDRRLTENRADEKQLFTDMCCPPTNNITVAAAHAEHLITSVIRQAGAPACEPEKRSKLHEAGVSMFYSLVHAVTPEAQLHPPTCQFFSACLEFLGQAFILPTPSEMPHLLATMLEKPALTGQLAPHFRPASCPDLFLTLYRRVFSELASNNVSPDVLFVILSKFDVSAWLLHGPCLHDALTLATLCGDALNFCGPEPGPKIGVVEVYKSHVGTIFLFKFPACFSHVLNIIIKGSGEGSLHASCLGEVCAALARPVSGTTAPHTALLTLDLVRSSCEGLAELWMKQRMGVSRHRKSGLLVTWAPYCQAVGELQERLFGRLVEATLQACGPAARHETVLSELFSCLACMMRPWLCPVAHDNTSCPPWLPEHLDDASHLVRSWAHSLHTLNDSFTGSLAPFSGNLVTLAWAWYRAEVVTPMTPDHVLSEHHSVMTSLPWETLQPSCEALADMCSLGAWMPRTCLLFTGEVLARMQWHQILQHYKLAAEPQVLRRALGALLFLLVRLSRQSEVIEVGQTKMGMRTALGLVCEAGGWDWSAVSVEALSSCMSWLVHNGDVGCILQPRAHTTATGLRLLREATQFASLAPTSMDPAKWRVYVKGSAELLAACARLHDLEREPFCRGIANLLTDIETSLASGGACDDAWWQGEGSHLLAEFLYLLNNCPGEAQPLQWSLETVVEWIRDTSASRLLTPLIRAASRSLANVAHMTLLLETCIEAHFSPVNETPGWDPVLRALEVPGLTLDEFLSHSVQQGCFLLLHAYLLQTAPLCQENKLKIQTIESVLEWSKAAKPSGVSESKLFLWWHEILSLVVQLLALGQAPSSLADKVESLAEVVSGLGEDRVKSGLLGAIGIARRSPLSPRFRVACKCIATFLLSQLGDGGSLRISPDVQTASKAGKAKEAMAGLKAALQSKEYGDYGEHVTYTLNLISSGYCATDAPLLVAKLARTLYPENNFFTYWSV